LARALAVLTPTNGLPGESQKEKMNVIQLYQDQTFIRRLRPGPGLGAAGHKEKTMNKETTELFAAALDNAIELVAQMPDAEPPIGPVLGVIESRFPALGRAYAYAALAKLLWPHVPHADRERLLGSFARDEDEPADE
jgi:hypothetical protein